MNLPYNPQQTPLFDSLKRSSPSCYTRNSGLPSEIPSSCYPWLPNIERYPSCLQSYQSTSSSQLNVLESFLYQVRQMLLEDVAVPRQRVYELVYYNL